MSAETIIIQSYDIHVDGYVWTIERTPDESTNVFIERCWYISSQKPSTQEDYEKAIIASKQWVYQKIYGCEF